MINFAKSTRSNSAKAVHRRTRKHKCTGPRTAEGKQRSSLNAFKHGLCSDRPIFPGESSKLFDMFRRTMFRLLYPKNLLQADFANRIVSAIWRLRRSSLIEDQLFAHAEKQLLSTPGVDKDNILGQSWLLYDQNITRLRRYQVSIERSLFTMLTKYAQFCPLDDRDKDEDRKEQFHRLIDALKFYQNTTANYSETDVDAIVDVCMKASAHVEAWHESIARAEEQYQALKLQRAASSQSDSADADELSESESLDTTQPTPTESPQPPQPEVPDSSQSTPVPTPPPAPASTSSAPPSTPCAEPVSPPKDSAISTPVSAPAISSNPLPAKDLQPASPAAPAEGVRSVIAPQTSSLNGGSA